MKIQLSVVIITFNEEKNIARCLNSIKSIADEIVVIDSFSTDKTEEICTSFGAKFIENPFRGHIEQKNFAITQASFSHVLSLDADEMLSEKAIIDVEKLKNNFQADAYFFNRLNNFCGTWIRHSGWYPDQKIRLFKKGVGSWQGKNPHDSFTVSKDFQVEKLSSDILHFTIADIQGHIKQINYFTDIAAIALYKEGEKTTLLKIIISPIVKFLGDYIFKLGFLDGFAGLLIAVNSAHAKFLKYSKLYLLHKNNSTQ